MIELIAFTYFASYILSRGGPAHQYILIRSLPDDRSISNNTKTSNISTNYRGFDNLLYLVELAWGLSITPISAIVSLGNALSLIFPSLILLEIWKDRQDKTVLRWCFIYLVFTSFALTLMLVNWGVFKSVSAWLGHSVIIICLVSLWGMFENIRSIYRSKNTKQQSLPEIYLKIFKDIVGVIYCFSVGIGSMYPLAIALASRGSLRVVHLGVYLYYSNKSQVTKDKKNTFSDNKSIFSKTMILFDRFISERFFKNFSLTIFSISIILLILFLLDFIIIDYQGFTFIPGLRVFSQQLFADSSFIATNTIEYYWGNIAIELIIASILFVQLTHLIEPFIYRQIKHDRSHWKNLTISLTLLITINFIFGSISL